MRPNIDPKTGIAYGVASGHNYPELVDDIMANGKNLSYQATLDSIRQDVGRVLRGYCREPDMDSIMDAIEDSLEYEEHEDTYEYTNNGTTYLLSSFGGAPLIMITKSDWTCYCNHCSPCIPNAGDLDNPDGATLAYCMPKEEWMNPPEILPVCAG